jgi:hypothetical protein
MKGNVRRWRTKDDLIRGVLVVYTTLFSLGLILFFGAAPYLSLQINPNESLGVVELVLPLLTGYIGLMLGYYYGTQEPKK